jgi:hypothetical protein
MEEASRLYTNEIRMIEVIEVIMAMITPERYDRLDPR